MKYAVVTGTSKGLGASIAKLLMEESFHVIGLARNINEELAAMKLPGEYTHIQVNLSDLDATQDTFTSIVQDLKEKEMESLLLVQNAALVTPIEQAGRQDTQKLIDHVHVNLLSPMIVTNLWLDLLRDMDLPLVIANVTSGAAQRSVYGWNAYCSTKAGLDRYTDTVALEQGELGTGNKVFLFDPSIMDTEMQGEIRSADVTQFTDVEKFKAYKTNNSLRETDVVAKVLVDRLLDPDNIQNGEYYSVKDVFNR
ncbi:benzil reductase ((S)-benzoin forming) [Gracilibacillus ureilyticus]|uniref:Benzil reductase ((S)-benzoin forming) n=1 Tax=Gracilibacillus ureilyticus TaxID=531814 RepID=A0A1H9SIS5_9BACI|nr:SDR family NAD(P)-dependent oxidoreductase [Gracilibacillus ureilyticus]SER84283.1 benzil reductase ((S)-benzoin forming) [Gracilibacillus ureilyticus]